MRSTYLAWMESVYELAIFLKPEYYKRKRHNGVSGNDPAEYEFYEFLDEILGHRPSSQQKGFDSSHPQEVTLEELYNIQQEDPRITLEIPDEDGAIPGGSTTPAFRLQQPLHQVAVQPLPRQLLMPVVTNHQIKKLKTH
ncbi:hypothetical protein FQR65_LT08861 [Abscondita terminalis]|nr:hypothetical protein FQR65_LT08861 [Abscondita terminalis]